MGIDVHLDILTSDWTDRISITDRLAFVAVKAKGIMFQVWKCPFPVRKMM